MARPILILGATGSFGAGVAQELLRRDRPVRCLIRDAGKARSLLGENPALELTIGNVQDPASLERAADGCEAIVHGINYPYPQWIPHMERAAVNVIDTAGLRQDFLFTPNNFVFALGQLDHIQTQGLNLRQTYGGGLGHDLIRNPRVALNFLGGVTFVRENFQTDVKRTNAEALLGEKLSLDFTQRVNFEHYMNFYPNLTDRGEYRLDTTSALNTRLSSLFSFNTRLTNRLLSNPLPGGQKYELVLTTGLGISF